MRGFEDVAPGSSETVRLFEQNGQLHAFGFVTAAMLEFLRMKYSGIDLSNLDVSVPQSDDRERVEPQPLPPAFDSVQPADAVDLTEILFAGRRPGSNLALLRLRLDPRHRNGYRHEDRRRSAFVAFLHHAGVPAHAGRRQGL